METRQIEIDLEVYKELERLRISFDETQNDILRRTLLSDPPKRSGRLRGEDASGGLRIRDGVYLPAGTRLRHIAKRRGTRYEAEVVDGAIMFNGKPCHSPSMAARTAVGHHRNGWNFWEYFDDRRGRWLPLDTLRSE